MSNVTWDRVKDLVWNAIKRRSKKRTDNDFREVVVHFFQTAIDDGRLPPVADFVDFSKVCPIPNANELPMKVVELFRVKSSGRAKLSKSN